MRAFLYCVVFLLLTRPLYAEEVNVPGELSHVAGGAVLAGGFTAFADKYFPEHRKMIGFLASSAVIVVGESIQMSEGESFSSSSQDMGAHILGATIGAVTTDAFALTPLIKREKTGDSFAGIALRKNF